LAGEQSLIAGLGPAHRDDCGVSFRIQAGFLEQSARDQVVGGADIGDGDLLAAKLAYRLRIRPRH
jgi:hypothetical protein